MIACPTDLLKSEGALLKNLHIIATDLMQIFDPVRLRYVERENKNIHLSSLTIGN